MEQLKHFFESAELLAIDDNMDAACDVDHVEDSNEGIKPDNRTGAPQTQEFNSGSFQEDSRVNSVIDTQDETETVSCSVDVRDENGPKKRKEYSTSNSVACGKEVAIQANDYDIERSSSNLPNRRRFVPLRFSDYRVFASNVKEEEEEEDQEDSSFRPTANQTLKSPSIKSSKRKRGRGRPRKYPDNGELIQDSLPTEKGDVNDPAQREIIKVPSGFKCNICQRVFSLRGNAKAHLVTHSDDKPYPCDFAGCNKNLRTKESLRRHKLSHMGIKMFECSECKKKFSCNLSLQEHMSLHTGEKPLTCKICGRKFRQIAVLKRHLTTHTNDKPYACGLCGRRFALKVYVHSHMKTHTGDRPFSCDECSKSFAHASDLNRHKIIHSGKKPYQCSICSMRYSDPSSRRRHEREHQNKQQYICHICSQRFPRAGQLRVHIVKEHSSEQQTSVPYRVEVELKSDSKSWATINMNNKADTATQVLTPNIVAMQGTEAQSSVQGEDQALITRAQPQTMQLVLDGDAASQVDCLMQEGIVIQENISQSGKTSTQTLIMEMTRSGEELLGLQSQNCTFRVVNVDDKNQVYEFHVDGSQFPLQEVNSSAVTVDISELAKTKEETIAFIQDENSFSVIDQPEIESALKINGDTISVKSKENISKESLGHYGTETLKGDVPCDTTVTEVSDIELQKTLEPSENANILLLEHVEDILTLNANESLPTLEIKPETIQETDADSSITISCISTVLDSDFISQPDLNSQEYYNWLAAFSETSRRLALPLDKDVFLKISQVQKTLSDYMASPSGVISDKNNFKILLTIAQDLSTITSSHLSFMYSNLSQ